MSQPHAVKIVVFDLGGVVVRICRSWEEGCRAAGVGVHAAWSGEAARERRRELNRLYQTGRIGCDAFFEGLAASAPGTYTADEVRRVHHAWTLEEYPGVSELIDDLHRAGLATGVLSNTNHAHWVRLAPAPHLPSHEYPTPRRMHHVHASHVLQLVKPDAEIYHEFARRSGFRAGAPVTGANSEIIFFDDLIENVEAARHAGWLSHQVDHTGDTAAEMRRVLRDMGVLPGS